MNRQTLTRGLAMMGLVYGLVGGIALAADVTCTGGECLGTEEEDTITGSGQRDEIVALGGNDTVAAGKGFDNIEGGDGDDELHGGAGTDELFGGAGEDVYFGDDAWDFMQEDNNIVSNDVMHGGPGLDGLQGGGGDDELYGEDGDDAFGTDPNLWGGPGNDLVDGGPGNDSFAGQQGNDTLVGGDGDDFIYAQIDESRRAKDTIHCGPGFDEVTANRRDIIIDDPGNDDVCEAVHLPGDSKKAGKAVRRSAKVDQQSWEANFLAELRSGAAAAQTTEEAKGDKHRDKGGR
jgi:Ca2+-binding RTX toxin-like protein